MDALFNEINTPTLICFFGVTLFFFILIWFFIGKRIHNIRMLRLERAPKFDSWKKAGGIDNDEKSHNLKLELDSITKRIRFFRYEIGLAFLGFLAWVAAVFLIIRKITDLNQFRPEDKVKNWFESILYHFDTTGLIIGLIGILVGILIFIAAENNHEGKDREVREQLNSLNDASERIKEVTNREDEKLKELKDLTDEIKSYLTLLKQHESPSDRFKAIKTTIQHATDNNNQLYVMTYAPIYGQYLTSNLAVMLPHGDHNEKDWGAMTYKEFYSQLLQPLKQLIAENKNALTHYWKNNPNGKIAILRNALIDPINPDTFRIFIQQRVMKGKKLLYINPDSEEKISDPVLKNGVREEYRNIFVHAAVDRGFDENDTLAEKQKIFIDHLTLNDKEVMDEIKGKGVCLLDYIPFQFYISIPLSSKDKSFYSAVVIFTNYYDLGNYKTAVSFSSQSQTLCEGLKDMFEDLVKAQEEKNQIRNPIKELFKVNEYASTIEVVLKNVEVSTQQDALATYAEVTPIADIEAKDAVLHLFNLNDIKYNPTVKYIKNKEVRSFIDRESKNDFALISLGLFFNPLSEFIGQLDRFREETDPEIKTRLVKFIDMGVGQPKMIDVALKGNIHTGQLDYKRFDETFCTPNGFVGSWDFAIITKQKIDQKWIFVAGGIDFYGSKYLIKCLSEKHCREITEKVKPQDQFAAVFRVGSDDDKTTDLCFLTKVNPDGTVEVIKNIELTDELKA